MASNARITNQKPSPLERLHISVTSVASILTDKDNAEETILNNLVRYHGMRRTSSDYVLDYEYKQWSQQHTEAHQGILRGEINPDLLLKQEDSKELSRDLLGRVYMDIGVAGELPTLSLFEAFIRQKNDNSKLSVVSDQKRRTLNDKSSLVTIIGRPDARLTYKTEGGRVEVVGLVEAKMRIHGFGVKDSDKMQLALYSRMMPKVSSYFLVERLFNTEELKVTTYTYEELGLIYDNVVSCLPDLYRDSVEKWNYYHSGTAILELYKKSIDTLIARVLRIVKAFETDGVSYPILTGLLTEAKASLNTSNDILRDAYNRLAEMTTPSVKSVIKRRDLEFFRREIIAVVGVNADNSSVDATISGYVKDYADVMMSMVVNLTANSKGLLWKDIDSVFSLV